MKGVPTNFICYQQRSRQIKGRSCNNHRQHLTTDQREELYPFNLNYFIMYIHNTEPVSGQVSTHTGYKRHRQFQPTLTKEFAVCHIQTPPRINL